MGEEKRIKDLAAASSITNNDYLAMDNANNSAAKKICAMPLKNVQGSDDAYSTTKAYKAGDLAIRNNQLYRCNTDCAAGSWGTNSGYFDAVTLTDAVTQLNNDLSKQTTFPLSTEEVIGTFNGKTLYRKVYSASNVSYSSSTIIDANLKSSTVDIVKRIEGAFKLNSGVWVPNIDQYNEAHRYQTLLTLGDYGLRLNILNYTVTKYCIVMEYTKA